VGHPDPGKWFVVTDMALSGAITPARNKIMYVRLSSLTRGPVRPESLTYCRAGVVRRFLPLAFLEAYLTICVTFRTANAPNGFSCLSQKTRLIGRGTAGDHGLLWEFYGPVRPFWC
jgi:hypothetical protein